MTQTPSSAQQLTATSGFLSDFDFAFNGVLDPLQVQQISTAAFVGRGENLLLVGGCATGKTVIAMEVREQATLLGMTSQYLYSPGPNFANYELTSPGYGYAGGTGVNQGLRQELLDCDVLMVDEVERWLEVAPAAFLTLLGRRIELGKSNILTAHSVRWKRLFSGEGYSYSHRESALDHPAYLLGTKPEQRSEWGMMMVRDRFLSVPYLLSLLGLECTVPGMEGEAVASLARAAQRAEVQSPFARTPVWHKLYTGENSYLEVLRRRA